MEKEKLIAELDERYLKKEGGKDMSDNEEFIRTKDYKHEKELEKLSADAKEKAAEYQQAIETLSNQLKEALDPNHRKHCVGGNCVVNQVHSQIFQEGVAYAKQHLAVDDIPPKLVGDWIREMRRRESK